MEQLFPEVLSHVKCPAAPWEVFQATTIAKKSTRQKPLKSRCTKEEEKLFSAAKRDFRRACGRKIKR